MYDGDEKRTLAHHGTQILFIKNYIFTKKRELSTLKYGKIHEKNISALIKLAFELLVTSIIYAQYKII